MSAAARAEAQSKGGMITATKENALHFVHGDAHPIMESLFVSTKELTAGTVDLVPVQIGYYYSGNVLDNPHLAQALAFGMFVVLAVMMTLYIPLQRRAARVAEQASRELQVRGPPRVATPALPSL